MTRGDVREAVFGSFDGLTSSMGVIAGALAAGAATGGRVLGPALGIAVAATIGMGAGRYLSDEHRSMRLALVMAAATLAGSLIPAAPFVTGAGTSQIAVSTALTLAAALVIGRYRGYRITLALLVTVGALTVALSALVS
jgi:VIT1/CCC1 family predicted Fe2+/Mn2+ transporter